MNPTGERGSGRLRLKPFEKKLIAIGFAVIIAAAGFTIYFNENAPHAGGNSLVIYVYNSFLAYGPSYQEAYNTVFGTFEKAYGVSIVLKNISAAYLLLTLVAQKSNPQADLVIGLTESNGMQAVYDGVLQKFSSTADPYINSSLLADMGPAASYLTPYEYSYLGIDFNKSNPSGPEFSPSFPGLLSQGNLSNLIIENPTLSDTGQEFLLWEISYYEYLMKANWTAWWNASMPVISSNKNIYQSWGSAFNQFESNGTARSLLVSYLTDPAYNYYFGYGNYTGSTATQYNGTEYGWRTIYNIGIVNGSSKLSLDRKFINYFLNSTVQNAIPTNEWMFPANSTVDLPVSYSVLPNQSNIVPLNNYLNALTIYRDLPTWVQEWFDLYG